VVFSSTASNLVSGDANGVTDIFLRDRQTGSTTLVSLDSAGGQANDASYDPTVSGDGRFVSFRSMATNLVSGDTNASSDIFVRDRQAGATTVVSVDGAGGQANSASYEPAMSADGRFVAFRSTATNLVSGDTNAVSDIFVRDTQAETTTRVSLTGAGARQTGPVTSPPLPTMAASSLSGLTLPTWCPVTRTRRTTCSFATA